MVTTRRLRLSKHWPELTNLSIGSVKSARRRSSASASRPDVKGQAVSIPIETGRSYAEGETFGDGKKTWDGETWGRGKPGDRSTPPGGIGHKPRRSCVADLLSQAA